MKEVYLDNSATTMAYRSVGELVQKVMSEDYGNPSSMHNKGVEAEKYIKEAKETFARLWKVQEKEVVYGEECSFEDVLAKMTPGKRNLVMAGVELYKRCNSNKNQRPVIRQSTDIYDYMQPVLGDNKTEECWAILMNSSARVIKRIRISSGGLNTCLIDIRVLLKAI